jgi:hypothetical protein
VDARRRVVVLYVLPLTLKASRRGLDLQRPCGLSEEPGVQRYAGSEGGAPLMDLRPTWPTAAGTLVFEEVGTRMAFVEALRRVPRAHDGRHSSLSDGS